MSKANLFEFKVGDSRRLVAQTSGTFSLVCIDTSIQKYYFVLDFSEKYCKLPTTASTSTTTSTTTTTTTQTTTHLTTKEPKYLRHCEKADGAAADILPGTCNFEKSLCGNKVSSYGQFWPITWHRTDETKDGIEGDHTHLDEKCK